MRRDIHSGQYLQARDDSRREHRQQFRDLVQHAVDAEADAQAVLGRLEMNVTGAIAGAARQNAIDDRGRRLLRALILEIELRSRQVHDDRRSLGASTSFANGLP